MNNKEEVFDIINSFYVMKKLTEDNWQLDIDKRNYSDKYCVESILLSGPSNNCLMVIYYEKSTRFFVNLDKNKDNCIIEEMKELLMSYQAKSIDSAHTVTYDINFNDAVSFYEFYKCYILPRMGFESKKDKFSWA